MATFNASLATDLWLCKETFALLIPYAQFQAILHPLRTNLYIELLLVALEFRWGDLLLFLSAAVLMKWTGLISEKNVN
jgi:hypothetical protein